MMIHGVVRQESRPACHPLFSSRFAANVDQYKKYFMNIISSLWLCSLLLLSNGKSGLGITTTHFSGRYQRRYYKMLSEQFGSSAGCWWVGDGETLPNMFIIIVRHHIIRITNNTNYSLPASQRTENATTVLVITTSYHKILLYREVSSELK